MTRPDNLRHHGDEVMVFDARGNYVLRGTIIGVHLSEFPFYDVLPRGEKSLSKTKWAIPESRLRSVGKAILAYERAPLPEPKHIRDEA
jgi:hypothetical protein